MTTALCGMSGDSHGLSRKFAFIRLSSSRSRRPLCATVHLQHTPLCIRLKYGGLLTVCCRRADRHGVPRRFGYFRPRRGLPRSLRSDTVESQPSCLVCMNWPLMEYFRHVSPSHWPDDFSTIILLTSRLSSRRACNRDVVVLNVGS